MCANGICHSDGCSTPCWSRAAQISHQTWTCTFLVCKTINTDTWHRSDGLDGRQLFQQSSEQTAFTQCICETLRLQHEPSQASVLRTRCSSYLVLLVEHALLVWHLHFIISVSCQGQLMTRPEHEWHRCYWLHSSDGPRPLQIPIICAPGRCHVTADTKD
jgi:hypothetical protein